MNNYEKMYYLLFNRITDIIEELKLIQQISEEMFITFPSNKDVFLQAEKENIQQ